MTEYTNPRQMMLMLMPMPEVHRDMPDDPATPEGGDIGQSPVAATTTLASLATMLVPIPDTVEGVMLVDPRAIVIDPVNVRHNVPFDPTARGELIAICGQWATRSPYGCAAIPAAALGSCACPDPSAVALATRMRMAAL